MKKLNESEKSVKDLVGRIETMKQEGDRREAEKNKEVSQVRAEKEQIEKLNEQLKKDKEELESKEEQLSSEIQTKVIEGATKGQSYSRPDKRKREGKR